VLDTKFVSLASVSITGVSECFSDKPLDLSVKKEEEGAADAPKSDEVGRIIFSNLGGWKEGTCGSGAGDGITKEVLTG
jgi:hypothetical protein